MSLLRPVLLAFAALVPAAHAQDAPIEGIVGAPTAEEDQNLLEAWDDLYKLRLGPDARWADDTYIKDGLCTARLKKGVMVPITSGKKVLDERPVGAAFFGEGELEVRFESKEEALYFANHMFAAGEMTREELAPIVALEEPYRTPIDRGILFTADTQLGTLMRRLDPVGGGLKESDSMVATEASERGVDAQYVVTSSKGELKAKLYSRNLLPDRRNALARSGMDPGEALQFDRMLHDAWGVPWQQLRMIMEFRSTEHRYHPGYGKRQNPYMGNVADRWLSCFRDGTDHMDGGLRAQVFSHAVDNNRRRFLTRFSTQRFFPGEDGPLPPMRVEPITADVQVEVELLRRVNMVSKVTSRLTVRALEDGVQHVLIRTPREESFANPQLAGRTNWRINQLGIVTSGRFDEVETIDNLAFMGLGVSQAGPVVSGGQNTWASTGDTTGAGGSVDVGSGPSTSLGGGATGPSSLQTNDDDPMAIFNSLDNSDRASGYEVGQPVGAPQNLIVALPRALEEGEEITLAFDWEATWPWGNFAVISGSEGAATRSLGVTTGPRSVVPRFLPEAGGNRWDFNIDVTVPPKRIEIASSGDTTDTKVDEGGWVTVSSSGRKGRNPAIALGRWVSHEEAAERGMPAVRAFYDKTQRDAAQDTPQQVRQTLEFMRRFMPLPQNLELEVYQYKDWLPRAYLNQPRMSSHAGLVQMRQIKVGDKVTEAGTIGDFKYLQQKMLAQGVVGQVWGQRIVPASQRDAWISDALTEAFSFFYVRAALSREETDFDGFAEVEDQLEEVRRLIETGDENFNTVGTQNTRRRFMSLTDGGSFAISQPTLFRAYSFYVLGRMLRERVGDYAFFAAIDQLGQGSTNRRVTTEDLRASLEATSGQDLEDFFAYWVRGGYIPEVTAEYRRETEADGSVTVHACITTDVPFGSFDLPIAVGTGLPAKMPRLKAKALEVRERVADEAVGGMIEVVDGRAAFSVADMQEGSTVLPDPFGLILAYSRTSKEVDQTTCDAEGIQPRGYEKGQVEPKTAEAVEAPPEKDEADAGEAEPEPEPAKRRRRR